MYVTVSYAIEENQASHRNDQMKIEYLHVFLPLPWKHIIQLCTANKLENI